MKLKVFSLIVLLITLNSCTRKIAVASNVQNLHHGGQQLYPYFLVKNSPWGIAAGCLTFTGLSYLGGYQLFEYQADGVTPFSNQERQGGASIIAGAGLALSAVVSGSYIFTNRPVKKAVENSKLDKWLRKYNRKNKSNLVYIYSREGYVILAPKDNKEVFAKAEIERIKVLENDRKVRNAEAWSNILGILGAVVLIESENSRKENSHNKNNESCTCKICGGGGYSKVQDRYGNADKCWNCKGSGIKCN